MGYAERVLLPGETVVYRGRLHWMLMLPGLTLTALAVAAALAGAAAQGGLRAALLVGGGLLLLAGLAQTLAAWVRRMSTEIIVSSRRVIVKTGLVARNALEMNLDKIESVQISQDIPGRLLDYGTVVIRGVGAGLEPIAAVARPLELQRHVGRAR